MTIINDPKKVFKKNYLVTIKQKMGELDYFNITELAKKANMTDATVKTVLGGGGSFAAIFQLGMALGIKPKDIINGEAK
jgi:hypothetical protein